MRIVIHIEKTQDKECTPDVFEVSYILEGTGEKSDGIFHTETEYGTKEEITARLEARIANNFITIED